MSRGEDGYIVRDGVVSCPCARCGREARWSICNLEGPSMEPIVRWFACGRHVHGVLDRTDWEVDSVHIYDLRGLR